jgi:hypothetical protein
MEAVMRLFSWAGWAALSAAAGVGFYAGESVSQCHPAVLEVRASGGELCDAPPTNLSPPTPVQEEIDLTCLPASTVAFSAQSTEPPLADPSAEQGVIQPVGFELPAAAAAEPEAPARMPYLTDDGEPAPLPPLGDVPLLTPATPETGNPIYQAVKKFVDDAVRLPEMPVEKKNRINALSDQDENLRRVGEEWRRIWRTNSLSPPDPITDKVPLGKPPVSEHPSAGELDKVGGPPR